jgi:hypothetical protein
VFGVVFKCIVVEVKYFGNPVSDQSPGFFPVRDEIIQCVLHEHIVSERNAVKVAQSLHGTQIDGTIADARADGNVVFAGEENPERDVLNRKIGLFRDFNP